MSWGEENDEELQQKQQDNKLRRIPISFKTMMNTINYINENQREWDDKTPRDSFRLIWLGDMLMLFIFFCLTYNVLIMATLPFIGFYGYVMIKLSKAYKRFKYKLAGYWWTTAAALAILGGLAFVIQKLVLG